MGTPRSAAQDAPGDLARPGASSASPPAEATLDQLLAEPIVQQLMRRDAADEAAVRRLMRQAAADRPAPRTTLDPDADDPTPVARLLHETARLWRSRCDSELRRRLPGMTSARWRVLVHLARHEGVNQAALARILGVRPITLVRLLDRLEADGMVLRIPDPDDRRAHILALTAKASRIIERIGDLTQKSCEGLELGLSAAEASQLRALLRRIRSTLAPRRVGIRSLGPCRTRGRA
jgi:MarR family transcriptional regulator, transcriptional regulator for hemolysin